jgi:hypothetical protein
VSDARNRVVWVGKEIPNDLRDVAGILGLSVEAIQNLQSFRANAADLLAVLVSGAGEDETKALGRLLRLAREVHAIDYGVLLGVVSPDAPAAYRLQSELQEKTGHKIVALGASRDEFARILRWPEAAPPANPQLILPSLRHDYEEEQRDASEVDTILLQRAFSDFTEIALKLQPGNFSPESKVWRVEAHSSRVPCQPFVAKAGRREDLQAEFETYRAFVRDAIPFPFRAPVLEGRFVKGASRAVLVSAFVSRSLRLDDYLATATSPELVMVSLFDGALGAWRRSAERQQISLGRFYVKQQEALASSGASPEEMARKSLLPDPKRLRPAFERARKHDASLPSPAALWDHLAGLSETEQPFCLVHGDLNIRNVFVRWNTIDTILIDFSHSGVQESLARDPAKLETSIALTAKDSQKNLLSKDILERLYRPPLLPLWDFTEQDGRTDAIRQIRRQAGGEGVTNDAYGLLIACHLLRFACEPLAAQRDSAKMNERRALTYRLACGILKTP